MKTAGLAFGSILVITLIALARQPGDDPKAAVTPVQAEPKADPASSAETKAVGEVVAAFVKAYNARDVKEIAAQFADDGRIVAPDGSVTEGREAIERRYRAAFEDNPEGRIEVVSEKVRLLAPEVAQEEGHAVLRSGQEPPKSGRYQALYVRRDGRWLTSTIYDFADELTDPTPAEHLKELEWLLGDWVDEGDGSIANTTCRWEGSKAFLVREFDLKIAGRAALSGKQWIGWDPSAGQFRSWVFDSEGGFSEGRWSREGDRWVIKNSGYVPDGRPVTATNVISREGMDRVRWSTTDRTLGDAALDEGAEVILVRKPPKPM